MNDKIRKHLAAHNEKHGWATTDESALETIREAERVSKVEEYTSRWWNGYVYVVKVGGMFIEYRDAETTGDKNARDCGYEFDPRTIVEVEPVERMVTVYEPVKE